MRPPAELDHVPWHTLTHAYGSAEDVPELIRALYEEDEEAADEAIYELYGNIHHQGDVYPATAPAVPFLAHAVRHAPPGRRDEVLMLLAVLAGHDPAYVDSPGWPGSSVEASCAELCRVLPELLPCLGDGERGVRRAALRVVAAVGGLLPTEVRAEAVARLGALYATDPVPAVRADALVVLARLGCAPEVSEDAPAEVRLAAAVLAVEQSELPYPAELVAAIAEHGAAPDPGGDAFPWSNTTSQEEQLTKLLVRDPEAALTVGARWIEAGDIESRGSWLGQKVAETWRDREAEVVSLLLAALPQQRDAQALAARLRSVGHWVELLPEPAAELRDTLHRHAGEDSDAAGAALLALVHARDGRALELVPGRPEPRLLAAAARHFPEAGELLIPVIRRELAAGATGNDGIALVGALAPFGAAARQAQPELVDCLRTGRAAIVAARRLGLNGIATGETVDPLSEAMRSDDLSLRASAAVARYQVTGEAGPTLHAFEGLLSGVGQTAWYLSGLEPMARAAAPLLPLIEPLLAGGEWTRMAAAEAHHWITGTSDQAVPVLADLVGPTPVGLRALKALTATGRLPEELRPTLESLASSPRRLLADGPHYGQGHPDEELRASARDLLAVR